MHGAAFIKKGNPLEESLTPCLFLLTSHLLTYSQTQRTAKKVRAIPFHAAKKAWRKSSDPRGLSMMRMANRILDKRTKRGDRKRRKKRGLRASFLSFLAFWSLFLRMWHFPPSSFLSSNLTFVLIRQFIRSALQATTSKSVWEAKICAKKGLITRIIVSTKWQSQSSRMELARLMKCDGSPPRFEQIIAFLWPFSKCACSVWRSFCPCEHRKPRVGHGPNSLFTCGC